MQELNQFCHSYLPKYFVSKYKDCKLKQHFFDYKNEENVFELTGKIFALIDRLSSANPQLDASKVIDKYFIFKIVEFKRYRNEIIEEDKCEARQTVRQILKSMNQNIRMCFQIFVRLAYFYFNREDPKQKNSKLKKELDQKNIKDIEYEDEIISFYSHIKILTMTQDDSFIPMAFMEYAILMFLNLNPKDNFFKTITKLIDECQFTEKCKEIISEKIENLKKAQQFKERIESQKSQLNKKESEKSQTSILQPKISNTSIEKVKQNESTPVKDKSLNKSQRKTHETSQKKENIISKTQQDTKVFDELKKTLKMHKKMTSQSNPTKQRTIYSRKKYLIPKKLHTINDQNSSAGSNQNNNNQELFIIDINRSFSARCLQVHFNQDEDFLAGATPKPKKKVKMEKTYTGTFDDDGNFVRGF